MKNKLSLIPLLERLTIQTKDLSTERIRFDGDYAWAQVPYIRTIEREYNAQKPVRIIILKARQLGMSTITEGVLFNWCFIHPGTSSLVIAHERASTTSIYEKTQMYWETWPYKPLFHTRQLSQSRITWEETRSTIRIATARNISSGRGLTVHALHASECAFWDNAAPLMTGLSQTIPHKHGSIIVLESTANGVGGWFYDQWQSAVRGKSDYVPLFFPWYKHPEYRVINPYLKLTDLSPEEKDYYKLGVDLAHLEWRRWAIDNQHNGDEDGFKQEYPATPEEAFLTTGRNIFPLDYLSQCYDALPGARGFIQKVGARVRFVADPRGPLTIFKWPSKDINYGQYFCAGDPSYTTEGDPACIQVINRRTFEQVAVWHGMCDPITFADELINIGLYYNEAEITCEIEGPGYGTIARIITLGYDNLWRHRWPDKAPGKVSVSFGWSTNFNRKHWAIGNLKRLIIDGSITIHDSLTYHQLRSYVVVSAIGDMGNSSDADHDDAVMALAICCICSVTEGPVVDISQRAERQKLLIPTDMREDIGDW